MNKLKDIYLAGGCFWGTEHFVKMINGVVDTKVGYANSTIDNPDYKTVCSGVTNAAETVKVTYDSNVLSLSLLLELYFKTIDPTSLNKQGGDIGTQYRTGIYYTDSSSIPTINEEIEKLQKNFNHKIVIEVSALKNFFPAEEYHQDYLSNNPRGYCHVNPQLFTLAKEANRNK